MPRYRVHLETVASTVVEVEADNPEEALDLAHDEDLPRLCAHCSGAFDGPSLDLGEWGLLPTTPLSEAVEEIEG